MTSNALLDPDDAPIWLAGVLDSESHPNVIAGVDDDDCAVLSIGDRLLVATTDFLNANPIALQLGIGDLYDLGRLLVAANLSDLCGTGATPFGLLTAITMEHGSTIDDFQRLMHGIDFEARRWDVPIVGGDTKLGRSRALLAVALGSAKSREHLFLRNGACANDLIWLSGPIGSCCAAVLGLSEDYGDDEWKAWARRAVLHPRLPLDLSAKVSTGRWAHSGTDISDGLGANLKSLCRTSSVGATILADKIPLEPQVHQIAMDLKIPSYRFAFPIGGDFQFLVTAPPRHFAELEDLGFFNVGTIHEGGIISLLTTSGETVDLPTEGHRDIRHMSFLSEIKYLLRGR